MCKKLTFMLMVLAVVGLAVPANAAFWLGIWDPCTDTIPNYDILMAEAGGVHSATVTGLEADSYQRFQMYDDIMEEYHYGDNSEWAQESWFYADGAGAAAVTYNLNTVADGFLPASNRVGVDVDPGNWVIAGSFGGAGFPNWDPTSMMMNDDGGGMYSMSLALPLGSSAGWIGDPLNNTFAWKSVCFVDALGGWVSLAESGRNVNTENSFFIITPGWQVANFYVNSLTGVVKSEVVEGVPEPATIALLGLGGLALLRRKR